MYRLQWSWDLKMCPHFRGCYVQASMELRPEDVSLLERCPHFRGCQWKNVFLFHQNPVHRQ